MRTISSEELRQQVINYVTFAEIKSLMNIFEQFLVPPTKKLVEEGDDYYKFFTIEDR